MKLLIGILLVILFLACGFMAGYLYYEQEAPLVTEVVVVKTKVIYRYPNTPPYEAFSNPIDFDQALVLLYGMRASHEQALCWEFESDPGFGIADKDLQKQMIKWYDQLIDFTRRIKEE